MYKSCITLKHDKYDEFKCIGNECRDNCCYGWIITIDKNTYKKYRNIKDKTLLKYVKSGLEINKNSKHKYDYAIIKNDENDKCPFVKQDGLCSIYLSLGEDHLSYTCTIYPRMIKKVGDVREFSIDLSCPEVARLLLFDEKKLEFYESEEVINTDNPVNIIYNEIKDEKDLNNYFWSLRIFTIEAIQNRKYKLWERLLILGLTYEKLDKVIKSNGYYSFETIIETSRNNMMNLNFKPYFNEIYTNYNVQLELLNIIAKARAVTKGPLKDIYDKFLEGIDYKEGEEEKNVVNYIKGCNGFIEYLKEKSYVIENYLVHYVYSNPFNLNSNDIFKKYCNIVIHYSMIKLYLSGLFLYYGYIDDEIIIDTIYSFAREMDHNDDFMNELLKALEKNGTESYITLAYMCALLKN